MAIIFVELAIIYRKFEVFCFGVTMYVHYF